MSLPTYTIDFTDPSKPSFVIPPMMQDTSHTSLKLPGAKKLQYGEQYNENLVRLLENFAHDFPPAHVTEGQIWYHLSQNTLRVFAGIGTLGEDPAFPGWLPITGIGIGPTLPLAGHTGAMFYNTTVHRFYGWTGASWRQFTMDADLASTLNNYYTKLQADARFLQAVYVADVTEYNHWVDITNAAIAVPNHVSYPNNFGYNQNAVPHHTDLTAHVSLAEWQNLETLRNTYRAFHGLDNSGAGISGLFEYVGDPVFSINTLLNAYQSHTALLVDPYVSYRNLVNTGAYDYTSPSLPVRAGANVNDPHTQIVHFSYASRDELFGQMNAGISLTYVASMTIPSSDPGLVAWKTFLETQLGVVRIYKDHVEVFGGLFNQTNSTGFYACRDNLNVFTPMLDIVSYPGSVPGARLHYQMGGVYRDDNVFEIQVTFSTTYASGYSYSTIVGTPVTISSQATVSRPSVAYFANPPVAYPTLIPVSFT